MKLTKIELDKANRMFRLGFGKHENTWFARVDFWWFAIRISWPKQ
jgi:hypothetical protein